MKKLLIYLMLMLPVMAWGQAVVQQSKTPSTGATAGNSFFQWYSGLFGGYLVAPNGNTAVINRQTGIEGQIFVQWADTTLRAWHGGQFVPISGGGGSSGAIYFTNAFSGSGTSTSPIDLNYDTLKNGRMYFGGIDSATHALRYDTTLYTPYYIFKATLPDGVISGLGLSIAGSNVLVASGMWRISGNTHSTSGTTTLPIDAQDPTLSRYDVVYGNASNMLNIISGTLSASPVYPTIPGGTILVGAVLITPTSVTTVQPVITNYVTTNTTQTIGAVKTFTQDVLGTFWQILANGMATFQGGVNSPTYNFYGHNAYFTYNAGEIGIGGTDAVSLSGPLIKSQLGNNLISFDYSTLKRNTQTGPSTIVTDYFLTQDSVKAGANVTITKSGQSITVAASGGGGGTVTSVGATGSNGILIGGSSPITTSGTYTFQVDSSAYTTRARLSTYLTKAQILALGYGTGTVTSITAGSGLTGGTITTSGTLKADTAVLQTILNFFPKGDTRYLKSSTAGTTYVPYAGASTDVVIGAHTLSAQSIAATGTGGNGYTDLISQSTSPTSTTSHIKIYSDSVNRLSWKNSTYRRTIQVPYPSDYTIRMPYLVTGTTLEDSTHASATYAPKFVGTGYSKFASGVLSYVTAIPNGDLANSAITINGTPVSLGASTTVTASTTAALTMNNGGAGDASGTTFNGGTARTLSYNTLGAAPLASPSFTGTVTIPTPFTLGATSVTSTGTQLNYLNAATGTTGTTSTNLVYSTSPTLVTPTLGVATATSINGNIWTTGTGTLTQAAGSTLTTTGAFNLSLIATATTTATFPTGTGTLAYMSGANNWTNANSFNRNAIAAATTQALVAGNSTAATVGTVSQWSPYMGYTGAGWNTTSAASNTVNFNTELRPVSAAAVTGDLVTKSQVNAGGFTDIFTLNSSGAATHTGTVLATANSQVLTGLKSTYTFTDGAFTGVIHDAFQLNFGASLTSYFHITDATGTGEVDLHFGGSTPTSSNWGFRGNTASTYLNGPTTSVIMRVANTTVGTFSTTAFTLPLAYRFLATEGSNGIVGQTTLVAGTKAITITGLTTSSRAIVTLVSQGGTVTTTIGYEGKCTANTLTINAVNNTGADTLNVLDTSSLNYFIIN